MIHSTRFRPIILVLLGLFVLTTSLPAQQTSVWELADSTVNRYYISDAIAVSGDDDFTIASVSGGASSVLMRSTNGGASWRSEPLPIPADHRRHSIAHPTPEVIVVVGDSAQLLGYDQNGNPKYKYWGVIQRSTDGGLTWWTRHVDSNCRLTAVAMCDAIHGVAAYQVSSNIHNTASDQFPDSVLITDDGWQTTRTVPLPAGITHVPQILCLAPGTFIVNAYDAQAKGTVVVRTTDAGGTWSTPHILPAAIRRISFVDAMNGWGAGSAGTGIGHTARDLIVHTTNGGAHWDVQLDTTRGKLAFGLSDIDFADAENGIAVGKAGKILRTRDGGKSWVREYPPNGVTDDYSWVRFVRPDLAVVVAHNGSVIRYTGRQTLAVPLFVLPAGQDPLPVDKVEIVWTSVAGATRYRIVVTPDGIDNDVTYPPLVDKITTDTSLVLKELQYWHRYYASVKALNDVQESDWYRNENSSLFYTMQKGSLLPPKILTPQLGMVNQPTTVTMTWEPTEGATGYDIEVGTNQYFIGPSILIDSLLVETNRVVSGLAPDTEYFVRVRARIGDQITDWSSRYAPHHFRTLAVAAIPTVPGLHDALLTIAPNPATSSARLMISAAAARHGGVLTLVDGLGAAVRRIELSPGTTSIELSTGDLPAGMYLARLAGAGSVTVARLVVIR